MPVPPPKTQTLHRNPSTSRPCQQNPQPLPTNRGMDERSSSLDCLECVPIQGERSTKDQGSAEARARFWPSQSHYDHAD